MKFAAFLFAVCLSLYWFSGAAMLPSKALSLRSNRIEKPGLGAQPNVLTHRYDPGRTGANLKETRLNVANVNPRQFGKLFSRAVDGQVYAQPLYVSQVEFADQSVRNVVYVATEHNSVYAFDADDAEAVDPLWQVNLGTSVLSTEISSNYRDLMPEVGITGTPVIDPNSQTIYVVAKSKNTEDGSYHQRLHALHLSTGREQPGSPVEITARVPGTGAGSVNGKVIFDPLYQLNRPGLLLLNGVVYVAFGSHGNRGPHHGWLLGYDADTLRQIAVFNTTPDSEGGSIWQSGQGLVADGEGNIYVTTGNGPFDLQDGKREYGNCALKFSTQNGLSLVDYFTPKNTDVLNQSDIDLGAGGPVLLPGINRLVFAGKDTVLRVLDTDDLGGFDPVTDRIVQQFQPSSGRLFGAPVYWESPTYGKVIYYWAAGDALKVYKLLGGKLQEFETARSTVTTPAGISNAAPLSLSANGSKHGTGIVWATGSLQGDANRNTVPGVLRAIDASDITKELWNSELNAGRDSLGNFAKFCPPVVANGKVFVATFSGQFHVYGLLPGICNFSLEQDNQFMSSSDGSGSVNLNVEDGCNWLASSNADWIELASASEGMGRGSIVYNLVPNPSGLARRGTLSIGGLEFTVTQAGAAFSASAASYDQSALATESIAVISGLGLAADTASASGALPTLLAGTTVRVADSTGVERLAPLFYVSPNQINYQIPADTRTGSALVTIRSADGNVATSNIQIEIIAPGLFSANATGQGIAAAVALRVKPDGTQLFESVSEWDAARHQFVPVAIDVSQDADRMFLILFGTGIRYRNRMGEAAVRIGNLSVNALYAGRQGDFAGLDQVNIPLPKSLMGQGDVDVVLKLDGKTTNTVKIRLK
ncbi:MAG: hypothetical protein JNK38_28685 [Acidobacteria bacterium]|nr:hypothetical protein [Acidobacteriota bacterium]